MAVQITIIGLGQIGSSIGLALRAEKGTFTRIGSDRDVRVTKAAKSLDVVDEIKGPVEAVRDSQIVMLCLPLSEVRGMLELIGPALSKNTILMDTAPSKKIVMEWAKELLPPGCFYVGLVPSLKAQSFTSSESGLNAAAPDLFKRTVMAVDLPQGTPQEVEQLAFDLIQMLGAKPMLTDPSESDGWMTSVHWLPQLAAAALLDATVEQAGWAEARKMAGRPYAGVSGGLAYYDDVDSLMIAALSNPSVTVNALDMMIASLKGLRDEIETNDEKAVAERLQQAFEGRERWLDELGSASWLSEGAVIEAPRLGEQIMQTLFGSRLFDRNRKKDDG